MRFPVIVTGDIYTVYCFSTKVVHKVVCINKSFPVPKGFAVFKRRYKRDTCSSLWERYCAMVKMVVYLKVLFKKMHPFNRRYTLLLQNYHYGNVKKITS